MMNPPVASPSSTPPDRVGDPVDDDVERVLDRLSLARARSAGRAARRPPCPSRNRSAWSPALVNSTAKNTGNTSVSALPKARHQRQQQHHAPYAEPAQQRAGQEQLQQQPGRTDHEIERAEELRHRVGVAAEPLRRRRR